MPSGKAHVGYKSVFNHIRLKCLNTTLVKSYAIKD